MPGADVLLPALGPSAGAIALIILLGVLNWLRTGQLRWGREVEREQQIYEDALSKMASTNETLLERSDHIVRLLEAIKALAEQRERNR